MDEISEYDFVYPENLIGLDPLENRQEAKMLVSNQKSFIHDKVGNLTDYLTKNDLLVFNNTKVIPCRLKARKYKNVSTSSTLEIEVTLNKLEANEVWSSFCLPGKKVKVNDVLKFELFNSIPLGELTINLPAIIFNTYSVNSETEFI